jgi:TRAP-type C4-dicarboxylate transport system permease small subunit
MKVFALSVFVIHTLFELVFGASAYLSGASSSQTAEQIAAQSTSLSIAFRFMGAALLSLGVLGALVIFGPGVQSPTARVVAAGFVVFHGLGALGSLYTAAPGFQAYDSALAIGAVVVHALLAVGFAVIAARGGQAA